MARYASFCLIVGLFKGEMPVFVRLWPVRVRVGVRLTIGAVRSAILATAGLLVTVAFRVTNDSNKNFTDFALHTLRHVAPQHGDSIVTSLHPMLPYTLSMQS